MTREEGKPLPNQTNAARLLLLARAAICGINAANEWVGKILSWALVVMTACMLVVIFSAAVLNQGWIWLNEIIVYLHAFLFMGAAAYSLRHDKHVRIDIFYNAYSPRKQHWLNLCGVLFFLTPMCAVIAVFSFPYVASAWEVKETSAEGAGLPAVFVLKTALLIMPLLLWLQGMALATRSALALLCEKDEK